MVDTFGRSSQSPRKRALLALCTTTAIALVLPFSAALAQTVQQPSSTTYTVENYPAAAVSNQTAQQAAQYAPAAGEPQKVKLIWNQGEDVKRYAINKQQPAPAVGGPEIAAPETVTNDTAATPELQTKKKSRRASKKEAQGLADEMSAKPSKKQRYSKKARRTTKVVNNTPVYVQECPKLPVNLPPLAAPVEAPPVKLVWQVGPEGHPLPSSHEPRKVRKPYKPKKKRTPASMPVVKEEIRREEPPQGKKIVETAKAPPPPAPITTPEPAPVVTTPTPVTDTPVTDTPAIQTPEITPPPAAPAPAPAKSEMAPPPPPPAMKEEAPTPAPVAAPAPAIKPQLPPAPPPPPPAPTKSEMAPPPPPPPAPAKSVTPPPPPPAPAKAELPAPPPPPVAAAKEEPKPAPAAIAAPAPAPAAIAEPAPAAEPVAAAPAESKPAPAPAVDNTTPPALRIVFKPTETAVPLSVKDGLASLVGKIKSQDDQRVTLIAYASGMGEQASTSRRVSLSRALSVRAALIEQGISALRINVQAEGDKNPGGDPDRVDIYVRKANEQR